MNNRLIAVSDAASGAQVAGYVHNGRGERVIKTAGGASTWYVYDLSGRLIGEYDASGVMIAEHVYGPSGRLASIRGDAGSTTEAVYWHHNDHLGTPQALTDSNGTVVWTASYTPFGIATVNEDPDGDGITVTNNFRFPGQYYDSETGLNYNYFRTYDPTLGRYTQHDPIGLNGVKWTPMSRPLFWKNKLSSGLVSWPSREVHRMRSLVIQRLMKALVVVKMEVVGQPLA